MKPSKAGTVAATLWAVGGKTIKVVTAFLKKVKQQLYEIYVFVVAKLF